MKRWIVMGFLALSGAWLSYGSEEIADFVLATLTNSTYTYTVKAGTDVDVGRVDFHFNTSSTGSVTVARVIVGLATNTITQTITGNTEASFVPDEGRWYLRAGDSLQVSATETITNLCYVTTDLRQVK